MLRKLWIRLYKRNIVIHLNRLDLQTQEYTRSLIQRFSVLLKLDVWEHVWEHLRWRYDWMDDVILHRFFFGHLVWVRKPVYRRLKDSGYGTGRDTKCSTNVSNEMLLNTAKYQGYSFYHVWVIKGKPVGRDGGVCVDYPPPLHPLKSIASCKLKRTLRFCFIVDANIFINWENWHMIWHNLARICLCNERKKTC